MVQPDPALPDPKRIVGTDTPLLGMTADEFRQHGRAVIDWIADFAEGLEDAPVQPSVAPGEIRGMLPAQAPEAPEPFGDVLADLDRVVVPGLTNWQSPNWFAYFPTGASFPSILAELVAAGIGQQGMLWSSSPICTELEALVLDWLVELMDLPRSFRSDGAGGGVLQMSASDSTHTALVVARHRAGTAGMAEAVRVSADRMVAYTSPQAHSSIEKGANVAGYGHVRKVEVDQHFAMRPDALLRAIAEDRAAGLVPVFVCGAVGTTGTTAVDPIRAIGEIATDEGLWFHVDAAYAGAAMICQEFRHHQDGLELADSYTWNPHKWLAVNFDCSVFHVADRGPLLAALSILPPYLRNEASEAGAVIDFRDWHVPLGRRPRALKLWFVLRAYGADGLRALIREHVRLARELTARLEADDRFVVVAPTTFALVNFRSAAGDEPTRTLAQAINDTGPAYLTPSIVTGPSTDDRDVVFIRVSIGATLTTVEHVEALWRLIDELAVA
ncbi:MAG: aromatic-L-amino-acid decarboxylase [Glaciecola sp.]|jgi:aromatic-L-amino-acid decarboxylase